MPFNLSGVLAACGALVRPRLVIPDLVVQDIRSLNFSALKMAGYKGVILDKDNCLTLPHRDTLVPDLEVAWKHLKHDFGTSNLLIVSNSAGTRDDAGGLAAESVSQKLNVPVLRHSSLKPSRRTVAAVLRYFASLPSPVSDPNRLIVIGDRVFTDVILAHRLGAYSILVRRDWTRTFKGRLIGIAERAVLRLALWSTNLRQIPSETRNFIREVPENKEEVKLGYSGSTWTWTGRALGLGPNSGKHR